MLPGAEPIVRSRDDWSFEALRTEFADALRRDKSTRIVFPMKTAPDRVVAVKALVFREFKVRLRSLYGRCRTRKEWENHLAALRGGLPTVGALALGELRTHGLVREAVILTEWRPDAVNLSEHRRRHRAAGDAPMLRIAGDLGRITAAAQRAGIYHNEIRPDNLLIVPTEHGPQVLLIDWKHARIRRRTTARDVQNLLRTAALFARDIDFAPPVEAEKRAFLDAYLEEQADRPGATQPADRLKRECPDMARILPDPAGRNRT